MAGQDETMRLAAEVVDKWSGPMRQMQKALRELSDVAKGSNVTNTAHVRDQAKAYVGLDRSVRDIAVRTKSMLTPALAAAGVSILSVGAAVAAMVKATKDFGDQTEKIVRLGRETGLTAEKLRQLDALASGIGSSPEAMNAGMAAFAKNMEEFRRGRGALAEFIISQHDVGIKAAAEAIRATTDNAKAFDMVIDELDRIQSKTGRLADTMQMRKNWLEAWGIVKEFANLTGAELKKLEADANRAQGTLAAGWKERGTALARSMFLLKTAVQGTADAIGDALAPAFTKASDAAENWIEKSRDDLIPAFKKLGESMVGADWSPLGDFFKSTLTDINNILTGLNKLDEWMSHPGKLGAALKDQAEQAAGYINNLTGQPSTFKQRGAGIPGFATGGVVRSPTLAMVGEAGPEAAAIEDQAQQAGGWLNNLAGRASTFKERGAGIPGFATGGVVRSPTLAMVGEAGPEAIVPLAGGGLGAEEAIKRPVREGTERGSREGVFAGLRDWFEHQRATGEGGGGVGGGMGMGGTGRSAGGMSSAGGPPGGAGRGAPSGHGAGFGPGHQPGPKAGHFDLGDIRSAVTGASPTAGGSAYLARERATFAADLAAHPSDRATIRGMLAHEDAADPAGPMEALANRYAYLRSIGKHPTVHGMLHSGFYGSGNANRPMGPNKKYDAAIDSVVLGGSNRLQGATDQGTYGDPNSNYILRHWRAKYPGMSRSAIYGDWLAGATTAWRLRQQAAMRESDAAEMAQKSASLHGAALRAHFGHRAHDGDLLQQGRRSGLFGTPAGKLEGDASLRIDLNGFPKGTRTSTSFGGMFKQIALNRGVAMPLASQT